MEDASVTGLPWGVLGAALVLIGNGGTAWAGDVDARSLYARSVLPPYELHCGQEWRGNDGNFDFGIRFQCFPDRGVLNWDVRFASPLKEQVAYPVEERGFIWWANGELRGDANGHREGPDYHFHGTMNPVFVDQEIECQDYFTLKMSDGSTSSAVFGGTIITRG